MGVRLNSDIEEVTAVPEASYYINKFIVSGQALPWDAIDDMPWVDYQLFIIMFNAWHSKQKADRGDNNNNGGSGTGGDNAFADPEAILVQGGLQ